jgi:hypothetical protein
VVVAEELGQFDAARAVATPSRLSANMTAAVPAKRRGLISLTPFRFEFQTAVEAVIASQRVGAKRRRMTGSARQSMPQHKKEWIASSLTLLAMTATIKHGFAISPRMSREFWPLRSALLDQRAQGMPDARCAR